MKKNSQILGVNQAAELNLGLPGRLAKGVTYNNDKQIDTTVKQYNTNPIYKSDTAVESGEN